MQRDLRGYANQYPNVRWPGQARVAVSFVLNVEEGAELSLASGDERNEAVHEAVQQVSGAPDLCMESHFEYGSRVGYWRITGEVDKHQVPLTLNVCSRALEKTPWIAEHAVKQGYEICCHGYRWEAHANYPEDEERKIIARAVAVIQRLSGRAPVGWHTKSSPSVNTRRLLAEHGGFLYDSDAYNDDAPYYTQVAGTPHLVLPYCFDTNDMRFWDKPAFTRAGDFADYCIDAFDRLWEEGSQAPRMLSIGMHTRILGRAGRIAGLPILIRHMQQKGGAWFARREDIARHWLKECPPQ
jgi:peptidoglycan/xylan/chitin deacetylase (PgdA/CDA1 family)